MIPSQLVGGMQYRFHAAELNVTGPQQAVDRGLRSL